MADMWEALLHCFNGQSLVEDDRVVAIGGEVKIILMNVWQMCSIWPELKYWEGD